MGVSTSTEHDYRTCRDEWCERFPCRVYREGYAEGYGAGHAAGEAEGYAAGFADGYTEGGE